MEHKITKESSDHHKLFAIMQIIGDVAYVQKNNLSITADFFNEWYSIEEVKIIEEWLDEMFHDKLQKDLPVNIEPDQELVEIKRYFDKRCKVLSEIFKPNLEKVIENKWKQNEVIDDKKYPCPCGGDCKSPECQGNGWHIREKSFEL